KRNAYLKACLIEKLQHGRKHALRRRGGLKRSVDFGFGPTIAAIEEGVCCSDPCRRWCFFVVHDLDQGLKRGLGMLTCQRADFGHGLRPPRRIAADTWAKHLLILLLFRLVSNGRGSSIHAGLLRPMRALSLVMRFD